MREIAISGALLVVSVIHLLPVVGVLGGAQLEALYGRAPDDPTVALLLRHRAVLFGILGVLLAIGALVPSQQRLAIGAGAVSVVSFLVLAAVTPQHDAAIARVVRADWIALACLAVAAGLRAWGD